MIQKHTIPYLSSATAVHISTATNRKALVHAILLDTKQLTLVRQPPV